jgi:molybdopterin synthase sulfur carrier subunit
MKVQPMQVKLYASLRQAAGTKMVEVELNDGMTVQAILKVITDQYPVLDKFIWNKQGELSEHAHVFVNSENIRHLAGLSTLVKPDDRVDIFPPLVGG